MSQGSEIAKAHFIGAQACALCHKQIAATQAKTAMANTWQGKAASWLPPTFHASVADDLSYDVNRTGEALTFSVELAGKQKIKFPVEIAMGGRRHGLGFLLPIREVAGMPLVRPALVQARYAWSPENNKLLLAPGCQATRPESLEAAMGQVLSPTFESRCVSCHGQPNTEGSGQAGGVHCEACHGPGSLHLTALAKGDPQRGIVNPKRLSTTESINVCARCHVGLTKFSDPSAGDLLVANQVRAIQSSECFLQSGKAFSCTACHDPHNDADANAKRAVAACLGCHSPSATPHAAICPINRTGGCTGCHMPAVDMGPLHLVDHLIRVHPEQKIVANVPLDPAFRTQLQPVSEYLRIIATKTAEEAALAQRRLNGGESFYAVAREKSADRSAAIGGYLGRKTIAELPDDLRRAAAALAYGETSQVVHSGDQWIILQRLQRDFRWDAEQLQTRAENVSASGDAIAAIKKSQESLMIYPHFLRALNFIGATFVQNGNPAKGSDVLATAARLYSNDAGTKFALASTLNLLGKRPAAMEAFQRVIALEPDFTAAYLSLGMLSFSANDWPKAIRIFQQGLQIDPLSAELNYRLGVALARNGDTAGGSQALALAKSLDSGLVARNEAER